MSKNDRLFKACSNCGERVHARAKACAACGAPSPWLSDDGKPAVKPDTVTGAPIAAVPNPEKHYIVLKDHRQMIGDVMVTLKKNHVLTDKRVIESLIAAGAPILPVGEENEIVCCPKCAHVFDAESARAKVQPKAVKARNAA